MRISGGLAKGRRTVTKSLFSGGSDSEKLRPTSSKVREALFDILGEKIQGVVFVDLYAGTGTVGIEALSRGGKKAIFVESDDLRVSTIKRNADKFGFKERVEVIKCSAYKFLEKSAAANERFDIFFIDPPYHSDEINKVLPLIGEKELLNDNGIVIVEHFSKKKMPETAGKLMINRSYRYGDTILTLYRKGVS
jgi:16S rRNA (guanine966-N2)-methyltransferase